VRKTGVMAVVITGGDVRAGDSIEITLGVEPHVTMQVV
jgi:MOSC domain-containing protein YiiM